MNKPVSPVSAEEMKSCPFCGSDKVGICREADYDGFGTFLSVKCQGCMSQSTQHFVSRGNECPQFYQEVRDSWNRRATAATGGVMAPDTHVLVPKEPTEEMFIEGMEKSVIGRASVDDENYVLSIWNAMLASAPTPPVVKDHSEDERDMVAPSTHPENVSINAGNSNTSQDAALQFLADQAQELDMGYGSPAVQQLSDEQIIEEARKHEKSLDDVRRLCDILMSEKAYVESVRALLAAAQSKG